MNEPPSPSPAPVAPEAASPLQSAAPTPASPARRRAPAALAVWIVLAVLAVAGAWALVDLRGAMSDLRAQVTDARSDLQSEAERATRAAREASARTEELARELEQVRGQRAALDQLYLELTRGRDEAALFDIERLVTLAAQDLRFTGHVPTALNALQAADARLARLDRPQYVGLRRALGRDIERLRSVPVVDLTGIALKLDQLAGSVDSLPLLGDPAAKPARAPAAAASPPPPAAPAAPPSAWDRVKAWLAAEFGDLVRIREVDTPEALLLGGAQQQLVRSQFRLRLLDARQALLARNEKVFRADLAEAQSLLTRYFDVKHPTAGAVLLQLRQLAQSTLSVDAPSLDESLAAIRSTRPAVAPAPGR
jgi:uroporphyrinogen III methyltransferase/synthase